MTSPFKLYPEEKHFWSFADYGAVLAVTQRLKPARVLEFGPGNSTLALIEGGAEEVDCCEDEWSWCDIYRARLEDRFPAQIKIIPYTWTPNVFVPGLRDRYDLALIDGPGETARRPAVLDFCLARCASVLVALECNEDSPLMTDAVDAAVAASGRTVEIMRTGPLAGAFALIGSL